MMKITQIYLNYKMLAIEYMYAICLAILAIVLLLLICRKDNFGLRLLAKKNHFLSNRYHKGALLNTYGGDQEISMVPDTSRALFGGEYWWQTRPWYHYGINSVECAQNCKRECKVRCNEGCGYKSIQ